MQEEGLDFCKMRRHFFFFQQNDIYTVLLFPHSPDWYYGYDLRRSAEGLFPRTHVTSRSALRERLGAPESRPDVLDELTETLLPVWVPRWRELFARGATGAEFDGLQAVMEEAVEIRKQVRMCQ